MWWFSRWKKIKIEPAWEYTAKGIIWRLVPAGGGMFIGEDRNVETKSATYFCLDGTTGHVAWNDKQFEERWWIGIETVHKSVLFLHEYTTPDLPDHKKIIAVSLDSGTVLWSHKELKFLSAYGEFVYASKDEYEGKKIFELDLHDGSVLREVDSAHVTALKKNESSESPNTLQFPMLFDAVNEQDTSIVQRLEKMLSDVKHPDLVEYIKMNGALVVGYYGNVSKNPLERSYEQHLLIADEERLRILWKEKFNTRVIMPVSDSFFAEGEYLYYIKDKKSLNAVHIIPRQP